MPKSRVRKKSVYTPPPAPSSRKRAVSPPWLAPTMVTSFVLGLVWISLYYVTSANMPVLRTLGAGRGAIMRIFLMCGASVGVTGTLGGTLIGVLFCQNIERIQHWV